MIKLIRKILGIGVKARKPRTSRKQKSKSPLRAEEKAGYSTEAAKESLNAETTKRNAKMDQFVASQRQALFGTASNSRRDAKLRAERKELSPRAGSDIEQDVYVTLEEAYRGVRRSIEIDLRHINIRIPRGAETGTKVQVVGAGNPGINGGSSGNLILTVHVAEHEDFARVGVDLIVNHLLEVSPDRKVEIPTLVGPITRRVPVGTQSGEVLSLPGHGMPKLGENLSYGDLIFEVTVTLDPAGDYITAQGKVALLKELDALDKKREEKSQALRDSGSRESKVKKNAEFHHLQEQMGWLETRRKQIQESLHKSVVVNQEASHDRASIGSTVVIRETGSDIDEVYRIVGVAEANPRERKISNKSPIGQAVLGNTKGSKITVNTPDGLVEFTIIDIR